MTLPVIEIKLTEENLRQIAQALAELQKENGGPAVTPPASVPHELLRAQEVMAIVKMGKTKLTEMVNRGFFPPPYLGRKQGETRLWRRSDIEAWIEKRGV